MGWTRVLISLVPMLVAGCAARGAPRKLADETAYKITVVSVEAEPRRPDGRAWDEAANEGTPARSALCGLLGIGAGVAGAYATGGLGGLAAGVGTRSSCASILGVREGGGPQPEAPDLEVEFRFGERVVKTPVATKQFVAKLEYPILVTEADLAAKHVRVHVADVDAEQAETMASLVVPASQFARPGPVSLNKPPGLRELSLLVERVKRGTLRREATVTVPGNQRAVETDVVVLAGQRVTMKPAGQVCTRWLLHDDVCAGPDGSAEGALRSYNIEGFGQSNHLALLALIGDEQVEVGAEKSFDATSTDNIVFFVNDADTGNNRGDFRVSILVGGVDPKPPSS